MKAIFRYGESNCRAQMIADQFNGSCKCTIDCPENFRGQKEQRAWVLDRLAAGEDIDIISNSDIIFGQLRVCVAQKLLKPEELEVFYYENGNRMQIKVFSSGMLEIWPRNFMEESINISYDLIDAEGKNKRAE